MNLCTPSANLSAGGCFWNWQKYRCDKCPAGYFSAHNNRVSIDNDLCEQCSNGMFQPNMMESNCLMCPQGYLQKLYGQTSCGTCPQGSLVQSIQHKQADGTIYPETKDCIDCTIDLTSTFFTHMSILDPKNEQEVWAYPHNINCNPCDSTAAQIVTKNVWVLMGSFLVQALLAYCSWVCCCCQLAECAGKTHSETSEYSHTDGAGRPHFSTRIERIKTDEQAAADYVAWWDKWVMSSLLRGPQVLKVLLGLAAVWGVLTPVFLCVITRCQRTCIWGPITTLVLLVLLAIQAVLWQRRQQNCRQLKEELELALADEST
jgi:hypothetical protein